MDSHRVVESVPLPPRLLTRTGQSILPTILVGWLTLSQLLTPGRTAPVPVTASVSLADLLNRLNAATNEEAKALLRELINKVKEWI